MGNAARAGTFMLEGGAGAGAECIYSESDGYWLGRMNCKREAMLELELRRAEDQHRVENS